MSDNETVKKIVKRRGIEYIVLISKQDEELFDSRKWFIRSESGYPYILYKDGGRKHQKRHYFHRLVLGAKEGEWVDHKNQNTLDNRRENIRLCTHGQNMMNRGKCIHKRTSQIQTQYRGVYCCEGRWRAEIRANKKRYYLGYYKTDKDAAMAYNNAAIKLHGEYARLNLVEEGAYV